MYWKTTPWSELHTPIFFGNFWRSCESPKKIGSSLVSSSCSCNKTLWDINSEDSPPLILICQQTWRLIWYTQSKSHLMFHWLLFELCCKIAHHWHSQLLKTLSVVHLLNKEWCLYNTVQLSGFCSFTRKSRRALMVSMSFKGWRRFALRRRVLLVCRKWTQQQCIDHINDVILSGTYNVVLESRHSQVLLVLPPHSLCSV
jgi:hypothetical protein